jgi:two-component system, LytTR family, response regulator
MIRCMIIDDEPHSVELMEAYVAKTPFLELVYATTNPLEAIAWLNGNTTDLIFLDVQMPELTGIDFMKIMPGKSRVVLCTSYAEYALEGYEHNIIDYLLKPVSYTRFLKAATKASEVVQSASAPPAEEDKDFLFIKSEVKGKMVRIDYGDIDYIESMRNYVAFHKGKEKLIAILNMKDLETELPASRFIRVHKSFIVAKSRIRLIEGNYLKLKNCESDIPIGGTYKDELLRALNIKE